MTTRRKTNCRHAFSGLWRLLQSRRLALVLLLVVVMAVVLALAVPQAQVDPEAYAAWKSAHPVLSRVLDILLLTRIYSSWWFYTAVALLVINTFICTLTRTFPLLRRSGKQWLLSEDQIKKQLKNQAILETHHPAPEVTALVQGNLRKQGYRVIKEEAGDRTFIFARKGDLAQWGSIIFHFSLVVILAGIVFVQVTRYAGTMVITEGQTVSQWWDDSPQAGQVPLGGRQIPSFQVTLERFIPEYYEDDTGKDYAADLVFLEENGDRDVQRVRINYPAVHKGVRFLLERYGFAPYLVLEYTDGRKYFESFVNLTVIPPGRKDYFVFPDTSLTAWVSLYPDMVMVEESPATRSLVPENPVLYLEVAEDGVEIYKGFLPLESSVVLGDTSLAFTDLRYWTRYQVIMDPGKEFIFGGLWLGLMALIVRYLFTTRQVWAVVRELPQGTQITLGGKAPQQDYTYNEEFASLVKGLEGEVTNDPD